MVRSEQSLPSAHSIVVILYHMLRDGTVYEDLGTNYFDERDRAGTVRRSIRRLESAWVTASRSRPPNAAEHDFRGKAAAFFAKETTR